MNAPHTTQIRPESRTREILGYYAAEPPGVKANLARILGHGKLGGTGKLLILPVDQGVEHGPARSFAPNPVAYDPRYFFELALEAGCNAYAAPLGAIAAAVDDYAGEIPLILKVNNNNSLAPGEPNPAVTSGVRDALRLGCSAIGYTIYPGSNRWRRQYEELRKLVLEARDVGLPTVVWSYPRGGGMAKEGETAVDVVAYAAHMACQLGAHIVKVKPPSGVLYQDAARKVYEAETVPVDTLATRVTHVMQSAFAGRRIVVFSGGAAKGTPAVLEEIGELAKGGAYGSIVGRNAFQRGRSDALQLLSSIIDIYARTAASEG